ncbi:SPX domain-containing protein [Mycotypha africana]|uniref:SPX domain-containing protein n=1 Tax=Mycotypha africana TaxID=64632 RepID=UPI0023006BE3|nr:SPX domain-containing protein [Mycotypha africana]KAI8975243.1 SPX domain-containing protein [Mycotypha africana]
MKFSKDLDSQCIPEWRKAYINYKSLKRKLKQVERFRKYKERKAAFRLNQVFQEVVPHSNNKDYYHSYVNHWDSSRNEHNTSSSVDSSKFYKMDMTERCHHRPLSRQCSVRSASTTLSVLDEVLAHASTSEKNFFNSLDTELDKVSRFYNVSAFSLKKKKPKPSLS